MDQHKPNSNLLWKSSFILPEFREARLRQRERAKIKIKPIIDEQQLNEFSLKIQESFHTKILLEFTIFGDREDYTLTGIVDRVDTNRIRIEVRGQFEWIILSEIVNINTGY
jgi:hypothetical protein